MTERPAPAPEFKDPTPYLWHSGDRTAAPAAWTQWSPRTREQYDADVAAWQAVQDGEVVDDAADEQDNADLHMAGPDGKPAHELAHHATQAAVARANHDTYRPDPTPYLVRETGVRYAHAVDFCIYDPRLVDDDGIVPSVEDLRIRVRGLIEQTEGQAAIVADLRLSLAHAEDYARELEETLTAVQFDLVTLEAMGSRGA